MRKSMCVYKCQYCDEYRNADLRLVVFHEQFCEAAKTEEYIRNKAMERAEHIRERAKDEQATERRKVYCAPVDERDALRNVPKPSIWY
jgi:hypothetical protein